MKMSEYAKDERKKIKGRPLKVQLAFFWDYYKWQTLIAMLIVAVLAHSVVTMLNQKDTVLSGILLDGTLPLEEPALLQEFYGQVGIDPASQEAVFYTGLSLTGETTESLLTYQRIHAGIAAGDTDFITGQEAAIRQCAYDTSHMLADLRGHLSMEALAALEGRLYYIDGALLDTTDIAAGASIVFPAPDKPEEMTEPIPIAIDISGCEEFLSAYYTVDTTVYLAIVSTAPNSKMVLRFVDFLLS